MLGGAYASWPALGRSRLPLDACIPCVRLQPVHRWCSRSSAAVAPFLTSRSLSSEVMQGVDYNHTSSWALVLPAASLANVSALTLWTGEPVGPPACATVRAPCCAHASTVTPGPGAPPTWAPRPEGFASRHHPPAHRHAGPPTNATAFHLLAQLFTAPPNASAARGAAAEATAPAPQLLGGWRGAQRGNVLRGASRSSQTSAAPPGPGRDAPLSLASACTRILYHQARSTHRASKLCTPKGWCVPWD